MIGGGCAAPRGRLRSPVERPPPRGTAMQRSAIFSSPSASATRSRGHGLSLGPLAVAAPEADPGRGPAARRNAAPPPGRRHHKHGRRREGRRRSARPDPAPPRGCPGVSRTHPAPPPHGARPCSSSQESTAVRAVRASSSIRARSAGQASSELVDDQMGEALGHGEGERRTLLEQPAELLAPLRRRPNALAAQSSSRELVI